jgi:hypothetical protein
METLAARPHIAPGTPVLPRAGMNRRSPNPISCAAQASAAPHPCRALVEAATHASTHPIYRDRYQRTKTRVGKQRGARVAQVDLARRLAEAIWHMLTRNQPFAPAGATDPLAARRPLRRCATAANSHRPSPPHRGGDREMSTARHPPPRHPP